MGIADCLLLALIGIYLLLAVRIHRKKRRKSRASCSGCCASCGKCCKVN